MNLNCPSVAGPSVTAIDSIIVTVESNCDLENSVLDFSSTLFNLPIKS